MESVEARLQAVRSKQQEVQRTHAQTEARLDAAKARKEELLSKLKERGFSSVEQARKRVTELQELTESALADVEEKVNAL